MSTAVTPTEVPTSAPAVDAPVRLSGGDEHVYVSYLIRIPAGAPADLRLSLELGREENGVWAHISELDVSAEGDDAQEALWSVMAAARAWLGYIRDEQVELAPELQEQAKYVALLEAPTFSWFRDFRFVE